jgi:hypothetical protein
MEEVGREGGCGPVLLFLRITLSRTSHRVAARAAIGGASKVAALAAGSPDIGEGTLHFAPDRAGEGAAELPVVAPAAMIFLVRAALPCA